MRAAGARENKRRSQLSRPRTVRAAAVRFTQLPRLRPRAQPTPPLPPPPPPPPPQDSPPPPSPPDTPRPPPPPPPARPLPSTR